jgi:ABC-type branched-subunit amino acid transport system permease subunit
MKDKEEKVITAEDVFWFVWWTILAIAAVVAVYALIWASWFTFRLSVTIVFTQLLATAFGYFMVETMEKFFGNKKC